MLEEPTIKARVHSINVSGELRYVRFAGQVVTTGFFKTPVGGEVYAHKLGLEGDAQGDLSVHGGLDKAVYFYPKGCSTWSVAVPIWITSPMWRSVSSQEALATSSRSALDVLT